MDSIGRVKNIVKWVPYFLGSCVFLTTVIFLFQVDETKTDIDKPLVPSIEILGTTSNLLSSEDAWLNDPTPLFLPTRWSGAQLKPLRILSGSDFSGFSPRLAFPTERLAVNIASPVVVPSSPALALNSKDPSNPAYGFGRSDDLHIVLASRVAWVKVSGMATGNRVYEKQILAKETPTAPTEVLMHAYSPIEFSVAVDSTGFIGPILSTKRSGTQADQFFLDYLTHSLRIADRLPPGFYKISVGP
jgi:hypothetical protein